MSTFLVPAVEADHLLAPVVGFHLPLPPLLLNPSLRLSSQCRRMLVAAAPVYAPMHGEGHPLGHEEGAMDVGVEVALDVRG